MSPAKMEVEMVVRVTCTKLEDEGAVTGTTHERRYEDRPQKSSCSQSLKDSRTLVE